MKNRSEKHQEIFTELNNLNTTNAEVILLSQLAMLCYGSVHLCKHTSSVIKFSFSRVTGMIVGTGLYSYRSFVLLRPSSEDCLQSVCSKYWLSLWMKYPFDLKTYPLLLLFFLFITIVNSDASNNRALEYHLENILIEKITILAQVTMNIKIT